MAGGGNEASVLLLRTTKTLRREKRANVTALTGNDIVHALHPGGRSRHPKKHRGNPRSRQATSRSFPRQPRKEEEQHETFDSDSGCSDSSRLRRASLRSALASKPRGATFGTRIGKRLRFERVARRRCGGTCRQQCTRVP